MNNQQLPQNRSHFSTPVKIVISCEFFLFQKGFRLLIEKEKNLTIIGEACDKNGLFDLLKQTSPDLVIINLFLPPETLGSLCKNIHEKYQKLPILVFLENSINISIPELIIHGVRGILWKENTNDELIEAINKVATGGLFFENPDNCKLNCHFSQKSHSGSPANNDVLSPREREVLILFTEGFSYKEIAESLTISPRTVESHKEHIQEKLNLHGIAEMVRYAVSNGII